MEVPSSFSKQTLILTINQSFCAQEFELYKSLGKKNTQEFELYITKEEGKGWPRWFVIRIGHN
jgi:hypothetical protein